MDDGTIPSVRGIDQRRRRGQREQAHRAGGKRHSQSYMHDRISAQFYGVQADRQRPAGDVPVQYRIPRMRNTYMPNGPHTPEEIIRSVKKGLYCESFTNGQVKIGPGDFTFYVENGYLIEDGKLTARSRTSMSSATGRGAATRSPWSATI